jgi:hypothetical protein
MVGFPLSCLITRRFSSSPHLWSISLSKSINLITVSDQLCLQETISDVQEIWSNFNEHSMKLAMMAEILQMKLRSSHMEPKDQGRKGSGKGRCDAATALGFGVRSQSLGDGPFSPHLCMGFLLFFVLLVFRSRHSHRCCLLESAFLQAGRFRRTWQAARAKKWGEWFGQFGPVRLVVFEDRCNDPPLSSRILSHGWSP